MQNKFEKLLSEFTTPKDECYSENIGYEYIVKTQHQGNNHVYKDETRK
jgi:hypothetical protein